jgi:hypothetical protein
MFLGENGVAGVAMTAPVPEPPKTLRVAVSPAGHTPEVVNVETVEATPVAGRTLIVPTVAECAEVPDRSTASSATGGTSTAARQVRMRGRSREPLIADLPLLISVHRFL